MRQIPERTLDYMWIFTVEFEIHSDLHTYDVHLEPYHFRV